MTRYPTTPSPDDEAWTWLDPPHSTPDRRLVDGGDHGDPDLDEPHDPPPGDDRWLVEPPGTPDTADTGSSPAWWGRFRYRLPGSAWAVLGAAIAILAGVAAVSATDTGGGSEQVQATAVPPSLTTTAAGPCTGLSGTVVTDRAGDPTTVAGVIASFEAAYYIHRDAGRAMPLLAPETGITAESLAAGIVSIPPGTRHCVAITPISPSTAKVHIAELRPDRTRVDYLQLINTRPAGTGTALLINNIQRQG